MMDALAYFSAKLAHETDPTDVYAAQRAGDAFVLVDVRSAEAWAQGHVPGAVHMPYREIAERAPAELDPAIPVVVYCWSPACNAGAKGAREFAQLGYAVREMIGGFEYWAREGQPVDSAQGPVPRTFDPLVMVVRQA
jgi:rhodanese-related sulfurtransferase